MAAVPGRVQARTAQARRLRRSPIVRAGAVPGGNVRRVRSRRARSSTETPRRRTEVAFDGKLRAETEAAGGADARTVPGRATPRAVYVPKCDNCSLIALCMPRVLAKPPGVARYLARALAAGED